MSKYVVIVFPDDTKTQDGTRILKELHNEGTLTVYGTSIISSDTTGKITLKQPAETGPLGLGVGALSGGLVGLLGGTRSSLIGGMSDILNAGVSSDFLRSLSESLSAGKTALLAEVTEEWVSPLDSRMEALGATVIREPRTDFEDDQIEQEIRVQQAQLTMLKTELNQTTDERKAKVRTRLDEARGRLRSIVDRAEGRLLQLNQETQAKVKKLQEQTGKAKGDLKTKIDQNVTALQTELNRRSQKLAHARDLTKETLGL